MPIFSRKILVPALVCVMGWTAPAFAAADSEGAIALKSVFEGILDQYASSQSLTGGTLNREGEIVVEPAGEYYAVTLPAMSFVDASGGKTDLGMIAINASAGDKPGTWKMAIALPSPIITTDETGKTISKIELGAQRMAGLWDDQLAYFSKLDAAYENSKVHIFNTENTITVTLPKMAVKANMEEVSPGLYSGPFTFSAETVAVKDEKNTTFVTIDRLDGAATVDEMSAAANRQAQKNLSDIGKTIDPANPDTITPEVQNSLIDTFTDSFMGMGKGFTTQYTLTGLKINIPAGTDEQSPARTISLGKMGIGLDMSGFKENAAKMTFRLGYDALSMTPEAEEFRALTPRNVNIDFSINNLPMKEIAEFGKSMSGQAATDDPEAAKAIGMQAMLTLPQILTAAKSNISFNNTFLNADITSTSLNGTINADDQAAMGATADMVLTMSKMDDVIGYIQGQAQKAQEAGQEFPGAALLPVMVVLKGLSKQETAADGTQQSSFVIKLDAAGAATVNGTDINTLMGGALGAPQQP